MAMTAPVEDINVPGTVHLVDLEGTLSAKHAKGGGRDIVLVPTPSNDPDDPLNVFHTYTHSHGDAAHADI